VIDWYNCVLLQQHFNFYFYCFSLVRARFGVLILNLIKFSPNHCTDLYELRIQVLYLKSALCALLSRLVHQVHLWYIHNQSDCANDGVETGHEQPTDRQQSLLSEYFHIQYILQ